MKHYYRDEKNSERKILSKKGDRPEDAERPNTCRYKKNNIPFNGEINQKEK